MDSLQRHDTLYQDIGEKMQGLVNQALESAASLADAEAERCDASACVTKPLNQKLELLAAARASRRIAASIRRLKLGGVE